MLVWGRPGWRLVVVPASCIGIVPSGSGSVKASLIVVSMHGHVRMRVTTGHGSSRLVSRPSVASLSSVVALIVGMLVVEHIHFFVFFQMTGQ